jgi:hypothetical protein
MALLTQVINIHYRGDHLSLLASDNQTPLYTVKTSSSVPQLIMSRHTTPSRASGSPRPYSYGDRSANISKEKPKAHTPTGATGTASFRYLSRTVRMTLGEQALSLEWSSALSRTSHFKSPSLDGEKLFWKPDGMWTGDFKLVDAKEVVRARFRNKVLSTAEVGSFEILDAGERAWQGKVEGEGKGESEGKRDVDADVDVDERWRFVDEVVISGLGMLIMVQSGGLAMMVLFGGDT